MLKKVLSFILSMVLLIGTLPALSLNAEAVTTEKALTTEETPTTAVVPTTDEALTTEEAPATAVVPTTDEAVKTEEPSATEETPATEEAETYQFSEEISLSVLQKETDITAHSITLNLENSLDSEDAEISVYYSENVEKQETVDSVIAKGQKASLKEEKYVAENLKAGTEYFFVAVASKEGYPDLISNNITESTLAEDIGDTAQSETEPDSILLDETEEGTIQNQDIENNATQKIDNNATPKIENEQTNSTETTDFGTEYDLTIPEQTNSSDDKSQLMAAGAVSGIKSITATKTAVNGSWSVKVAVEINDNLIASMNNVSVTYQKPISHNDISFSLWKESPSVYAAYLPVSNYDESGLWQISNIQLQDKVSGSQTIYGLGVNPYKIGAVDISSGDFTIEGSTADITAPEFKSITVDKSSIISGGYITFTVAASDNLSGIRDVTLRYHTSIHGYVKEFNLKKTSEGIYTGTFIIGKNEETGLCQLDNIIISDYADNYNFVINSNLNPSSEGAIDLSGGNFTIQENTGKGPELKSISVDKNKVTGGQSVRVRVEATDDVSPVRTITLQYKKPISGENELYYFTKTAENIYETNILISDYAEPGFWKVDSISIVDEGMYSFIKKNSEIYGNNTTTINMSNGDFTVEGTVADTQAPGLNSISIDKNAVTGGNVATVTVQANDAVSGVSRVRLYYQSPSNKVGDSIEMTKAAEGVYTASIPIHAFVEAGVWKVSSIELLDNAKNSTTIYATNVNLSGGNYTVSGTGSDVTPPQLDSVAIDKTTVIQGENITLRVHATDTQAGVNQIYAIFTDPNEDPVPVGLQRLGDGSYAGSLNVAKIGNWKMRYVYINDNCNNQKYFLDINGVNAWSGVNHEFRDFSSISFNVEKTTKQYVISFNLQGDGIIAGGTVPFESKLTEPSNPEKAGYLFCGWYKESACMNAWDFLTDSVTSDVTLYAKWKPKSVDWKKGNDGDLRYYRNGSMVINEFAFDGSYTYYMQANGTPMKDRLTYHPDGKHLIYLDENGHELFNTFKYCKSVGYTCYFDSNGYLYKDKITFINNKPYYLDGDGRMRQTGWFRFANGVDYGYANADGTLMCSGFSYDPWGRVVFYHWNGMVARGLISDGAWYYSMDTTDGHYLGQFPVY